MASRISSEAHEIKTDFDEAFQNDAKWTVKVETPSAFKWYLFAILVLPTGALVLTIPYIFQAVLGPRVEAQWAKLFRKDSKDDVEQGPAGVPNVPVTETSAPVVAPGTNDMTGTTAVGSSTNANTTEAGQPEQAPQSLGSRWARMFRSRTP